MSLNRPLWTRDVDHEVAQAIYLYLLLNNRSVPTEVRWSAARTAFSAHFRALMEFFHDGRPSGNDWTRQPCERPRDVHLSDALDDGSNPFSRSWAKADLKRLCDADKLVGHLSARRATRRRMRKEWGSESDWRLLRPKLTRFLKAAANHPDWYPNALAAARSAGLVR